MTGTLDAFNSQPAGGGGPAVKFDAFQIGQSFNCTVARDVTNADTQQITEYKTQAPKFFRDGRPMLQLVVPVILEQPDADHPDGRASLYVKSGLRDALAQAMTEAGLEVAPKGGDQMQVTLVERRNTGQGNPKNIFRVQYHRPGSAQQAPALAPEIETPRATPEQAPAPEPQAPASEPKAPAQAPAPLPVGIQLTPEQQALLGRLQGGQS